MLVVFIIHTLSYICDSTGGYRYLFHTVFLLTSLCSVIFLILDYFYADLFFSAVLVYLKFKSNKVVIFMFVVCCTLTSKELYIYVAFR